MSGPASDYPSIRDLKWSPEEKSIARNAFSAAFQRELDAVMSHAKKMVNSMEQPEDLWELEAYLTRTRKKVDSKYDYRYSVLPLVFANLLQEGLLKAGELESLGEDKLAYIRSYQRFAAELPAPE